MLKRIHKYVLTAPQYTSKIEVMVPHGAHFVSVAVQRGQVCVWAEVDPSAPLVERPLYAVMTGFEVPEKAGRFIGTVLLHEGAYVFHIYEASDG